MLTWAILRETGVLLWLVICLAFVGGEWFWYRSIALGRTTRSWYEDLKVPSAEAPKSASEIGESALAALGTGTETLLYQAKKQLGMDVAPPTSRAQKPLIEATAEPAPEPVKPANAAIASAAAQVTPESVAAPSVTFDASQTTTSPETDTDASIETDANI
ncbi:MAG: hypothetical protein AAF722_08960 [Cyanobacteria bacterium P01_C01_bin.70]